MAIVFDCPHCGTNYRLRDEFGGKTATCKNPNCRKVIPIPMPNGRPQPPKPEDLDAIAAAAFAEETAQKQAGSGEMIEVTCAGCDHVWKVEAAKEGKNVLCPQCRRPNRVPLRKKEEKADWRTGGGGPSMAKKETGLDREGAFATAAMGGISDQTAREIVKGREAEEEPEERRKKLLKRGAIATLFIAVLGAGGYYVFKTQKSVQYDAKMEDAVKELTDATKDPRMEAIIRRASGEHKSRNATSEKEIKDALVDLQLARNRAKAARDATDKNGILGEVAITLAALLGTTEQVDKGERMKKDALLPEFRQTFQAISDPDQTAEALRDLTRKFAAVGQPMLAEEFTHQLGHPAELIAQIGLELLRLNKDANRHHAEELLRKAEDVAKLEQGQQKAGASESPALQALRLVLGKQVTPKKGESAAPTSPIATAEAAALSGDFDRAMKVGGRPEEKARALAAAGNVAVDTNPAKAAELLRAAAELIKADAKGLVSPFVAARVCRQLTLAAQTEAAESLAASLPDDPSRAWARLGMLRARLTLAKDGKADDAWLDPIGDPAKLAAAAKAREEIARHNAARGVDYQNTVKSWPKGSVRPFGMAGLVLGKQDPK